MTDMVTEDRSELLVMLLVHDDDPGSYALARQAPGHRRRRFILRRTQDVKLRYGKFHSGRSDSDTELRAMAGT